ncbi:hypothetical protein AGMMS50276_12500 [Synergistales bacterium]|nr:hypothetical protein AGMMS50276_12500 [Synergistales bacterium]
MSAHEAHAIGMAFIAPIRNPTIKINATKIGTEAIAASKLNDIIQLHPFYNKFLVIVVNLIVTIIRLPIIFKKYFRLLEL